MYKRQVEQLRHVYTQVGNVDLDYIKKKNISLLITATANAVAVAEHVIYMMMSISKSISQYDNEVRSGDTIAYMGESGSINGSKLHFEIWGKGQKLDPEKWLTKRQ